MFFYLFINVNALHLAARNGNQEIVDYILTQNPTFEIQQSFKGCRKLKQMKTLPNDMEFIPASAFFGCISLIEIVIPESVKYIQDNAFNGCISLKRISLPQSLIGIGVDVFSVCTSLVEINLPQSLQIIGANAFFGCSSLVKIEIPPLVKEIKILYIIYLYFFI